jgi:hypothetical protein
MRQIPALGVAATRSRLLRELGHAPDGLGEIALETLLTRLAEATLPGRPGPTKAGLAELVEAAVVTAREKVAARPVCGCGHAWSEHRCGRGCFGCECGQDRPAPAADVPVSLLIGADIVVTDPESEWVARAGMAIARDGDGLVVKLRGLSERVTFDRSQLDARPRPALVDFYARPSKRGH